jgi:arginyl-tRNA synthetase
MSLLSTLTDQFATAFAACGYDRAYGEVVISQRADLGQFQCNGALPAAGRAKEKPRDVAQRVLDALPNRAIFQDLSLAGPGFINITLTDEYLTDYLRGLTENSRMDVPTVATPKKVVVDFGGMNVAKEMHVGHLRSSIIGDSLQRLLRFQGHEVVSDIHLGDWGTQMGQVIIGLQLERPDLIYFDPNYTGPYPAESPITVEELAELYPKASSLYKTDEEFKVRARQATVELQQGRPGYRALWQHYRDISVEAMKREFATLGVHSDLWYGEAQVDPRLQPMLKWLTEAGFTEVSDGAVVIPVQEEGESKEIPPLLLVKSDGAVLYATTDLATIQERVEDLHAQLMLYVVDQRQSLHFEQVFRAAKKTGIAPKGVEMLHLGFGTMNGPDGRPFKTREGGIMRLRDLIDMVTEQAHKRMEEVGAAKELPSEERAAIARQVGVATLRFADLQNHRTSDYIFDIERFSSFEGRTGPYLLYSAVRIQSILRKADERGLEPGLLLPPTNPDERDLLIRLTLLPEVISRMADGYAPNFLCEHAFLLAQQFNRFYNSCHILTESNVRQQASWLALCELCLRQFQLISELLGLEIPERM